MVRCGSPVDNVTLLYENEYNNVMRIGAGLFWDWKLSCRVRGPYSFS